MAPTFKKLYDEVKASFSEKMSRKTGWGRNEVMTEFDSAWVNALSKLSETEKPNSQEATRPILAVWGCKCQLCLQGHGCKDYRDWRLRNPQ